MSIDRVAKTARKAKYSDSLPVANPFYTSSGFLDDLATAAASLHLATGNAAFLNEAKSTSTFIVDHSLHVLHALLLCTLAVFVPHCMFSPDWFGQWVASGQGWHGWDWDNQQWSAAILLHRADPGYQPAKSKLDWFIGAWQSQQTTPTVCGTTTGHLYLLGSFHTHTRRTRVWHGSCSGARLD